MVLVLAWVYYSACILFFGAEITKGYARKFGSGITPNSRAVLIDDLLRARLGLTTATIDAASIPPTVPPPDSPPELRMNREACADLKCGP